MLYRTVPVVSHTGGSLSPRESGSNSRRPPLTVFRSPLSLTYATNPNSRTSVSRQSATASTLPDSYSRLNIVMPSLPPSRAASAKTLGKTLYRFSSKYAVAPPGPSSAGLLSYRKLSKRKPFTCGRIVSSTRNCPVIVLFKPAVK